jgi:hypothetical protein
MISWWPVMWKPRPPLAPRGALEDVDAGAVVALHVEVGGGEGARAAAVEVHEFAHCTTIIETL